MTQRNRTIRSEYLAVLLLCLGTGCATSVRDVSTIDCYKQLKGKIYALEAEDLFLYKGPSGYSVDGGDIALPGVTKVQAIAKGTKVAIVRVVRDQGVNYYIDLPVVVFVAQANKNIEAKASFSYFSELKQLRKTTWSRAGSWEDGKRERKTEGKTERKTEGGKTGGKTGDGGKPGGHSE